MPRQNLVILYGQAYHESSLGYNTNDVNDPDRRLYRTSNNLRVIRGFRPFGAQDKRLRVDNPLIATSDRNLMAQMRNWQPGTMYLVKGNLITLNGRSRFTCPDCGKDFLVNATYAFVNPISIIQMEQQLTWADAVDKMVKNKEWSNICQVFGYADTEPEKFVTDKGQVIVNYKLRVPRKYHIREDHSDVKTDFPIIKAYGNVALNDFYGVKLDGEVFVDGMIQTRTFERDLECPECGQIRKYSDSSTEIVSYSTEYGRGCLTMEEVQKKIKDAEDDEVKASLAKLGLLDDDE